MFKLEYVSFFTEAKTENIGADRKAPNYLKELPSKVRQAKAHFLWNLVLPGWFSEFVVLRELFSEIGSVHRPLFAFDEFHGFIEYKKMQQG